jgi:predicted PurR-regulated permease PerM
MPAIIRRPMTTIDEETARTRRDQWWRSAFFLVGTIYLGLLLLSLLLDVLGGFVQIALTVFLAWLLAFVLSPLVAVIVRRTGVPRGVAVGVVYAATLVVSGFLLFYAVSSIGASMGELTEEWPVVREQTESRLRNWQELVSFGRFQPDLVGLYRDLEGTLTRIGTSIVGDVPQVTIAVLGSLVLVVILSLYMVADAERIVRALKRVAPSRWSDEVDILERTVTRAFGGFLRAQVILAAIQAGLTIAVVLLLGLPYGFIIVAVSTLAMLVPFFGPPLALVPPIVAVGIFDPDWFLVVAPALLVVQTVLVNWLQPRLLHDALGMHPILVLVGLLVGAQIAGVWGALFGIPILAVANVFFSYLVNLRTIEESPNELEEVIEEVRQEMPEAEHEELVALAAERVEESDEEGEPAATADGRLGEVGDDLRHAAGDLRAAASEQREAAGQVGESASELRGAVDRLVDREDRRDRQA